MDCQSSRRIFIKWCIFIFVFPLALIVGGRASFLVGYIVGQTLTFLNLAILNNIAPALYHQFVKDNGVAMQTSQIGGSVLGACTCILLLRYFWHWLYNNEEKIASTPLGIVVHHFKKFLGHTRR